MGNRQFRIHQATEEAEALQKRIARTWTSEGLDKEVADTLHCCAESIDRMRVLLEGGPNQNGDIDGVAANDFPEHTQKVLDDCSARVYEAVSVLHLCSYLLTQDPTPEHREVARVMSAVDGAIRILEPITDEIGCTVALAKAVNRHISASMEVTNG